MERPADTPILALDVGRVRIGVAVSDADRTLASPHSVLNRKGRATDYPAIERLCREMGAATVVVGLPLAADGGMTAMAEEIQRWVKRLRAFLPPEIEVVTCDEALTTAEAEELLGARGVRGKKRRQIVDQVAAAFILESYLHALNEGRASRKQPFEGAGAGADGCA